MRQRTEMTNKIIEIMYENDYVLSTEMKNILDERLQEDEATYLTSEDFINQLNEKYGL